MVNDNGGNDAGSTVLQESLDSVRAVGRVHHTEAANITDIRVPGRRRSKAVPLELSDYGCQVASMTKALENKKELEEGHVILAVNGEPTDGAQDARRALRNAFDDKRDEVKLTVWKAPDDFVFPDTAGEGTAAVGENGGQFDVVVQEAMLMTESERVNVKRIVCRLEGGAKAENLKHICRALEITPKTKKWNLAAIEVVLKQKRFRQYDTFRPTSQNMTLSYDRFYESIRLRELPQFPGEYEYVSYSIRQVVAELIKFTHASPSGPHDDMWMPLWVCLHKNKEACSWGDLEKTRALSKRRRLLEAIAQIACNCFLVQSDNSWSTQLFEESGQLALGSDGALLAFASMERSLEALVALGRVAGCNINDAKGGYNNLSRRSMQQGTMRYSPAAIRLRGAVGDRAV